ncbi:KN motif and ankyrin repeat domain [Dermatophagoides pteronyssinus]|uniref:KN motif and ankyrin repeat domain n=1 Tax=Dermatophagoides pteronyssinus TaxID=6956 RepID=A0ABQ8IXM4_DERPT|nr:KN motif and ankyrin repeat domain [Dermatophagoides pteronyssinus]
MDKSNEYNNIFDNENNCDNNKHLNYPCKCCPYGFHIDTDFVRYCDALLSALYGQNSNQNYQHLNNNNNNNDNRSASTRTTTPSPSLINYQQPNDEYLIDNNHNNNDQQQINHQNDILDLDEMEQDFQQSNQISNESLHSKSTNFSSSIDNEDKISVSIAIATIDTAIEHYQQEQEEELNNHHQIIPQLLSESSCSSLITTTTTLSKSVLTQIRNDLAQSLLRVKELENQVEQIPILKKRLAELESERLILMEKLTTKQNEKEMVDNSNVDSAKLPEAETIDQTKINGNNDYDDDVAKEMEKLSLIKFETFNVEPSKRCHIGTLTNFAPCVLYRNAFVQTDLKCKDIRPIVETMESSTITDINLIITDQCDGITREKIYDHSNMASNIDSTVDVQHDKISRSTDNDNDTSSADDESSSIEVLRHCHNPRPSSPLQLFTSLDDGNDFHPHSNITNSNDIAKDILGCLPSQFVVRRRRRISVDPKMTGRSNVIPLLSPSSNIEDHMMNENDKTNNDNMILRMISSSTEFESIPLSDESESAFSTLSNTTNKDYKNQQQQPLSSNKKLFVATGELKAALKIMNENLFSPPKCPLLFSKSMAVVGKNWFRTSSSVDSDFHAVESYLDFVEKFYTTKLLEWLVNLADPNGNTALHYAISYNNFDIVSILLDSKVCDVNKFNKNGYTATMLVSLAKIENELHRDIVERLFTMADINLKAKQNGQTALMLAASHGRIEITKILLECGAEVNLQDNDGSTALMCAAEHGHTEVISLLLSHSDCDPLIEDNEGSTALKIALINGHNDIGVLLYAVSGPHYKRNGSFNYHNSSSISHRLVSSPSSSSSSSNYPYQQQSLFKN